MRQLRDDFRKLKAANPDYLLAFGFGDFFEFRYCDASDIHEALPDVAFDDTVEYSRIKVHKLGIFQFSARLAAKGLKVAMVARTLRNGKASYRISGRSDR